MQEIWEEDHWGRKTKRPTASRGCILYYTLKVSDRAKNMLTLFVFVLPASLKENSNLKWCCSKQHKGLHGNALLQVLASQ